MNQRELLDLIADTLDNTEAVINSYEELIEERGHVGGFFNRNYTSIYGVRCEENKFFKWALQLLRLIELYEGGSSIKASRVSDLVKKLHAINRACNEALNLL